MLTSVGKPVNLKHNGALTMLTYNSSDKKYSLKYKFFLKNVWIPSTYFSVWTFEIIPFKLKVTLTN